MSPNNVMTNKNFWKMEHVKIVHLTQELTKKKVKNVYLISVHNFRNLMLMGHVPNVKVILEPKEIVNNVGLMNAMKDNNFYLTEHANNAYLTLELHKMGLGVSHKFVLLCRN